MIFAITVLYENVSQSFVLFVILKSICPFHTSKSITFDFLKNTTIMISMNAFNFNYNGNGGASQQSLYPLGAGTPEVVCSDCYADLGATVKLIVQQDGHGGVTVLRGAVTGSTGKS